MGFPEARPQLLMDGILKHTMSCNKLHLLLHLTSTWHLHAHADFACLWENLCVFNDQWCLHFMHVEYCETTEKTQQTNPSTPPAFCYYMQHRRTCSHYDKERQPFFLILQLSSRLCFVIDILDRFASHSFSWKNSSNSQHDLFIHWEKSEKLIYTKCVTWSIRIGGWGWV